MADEIKGLGDVVSRVTKALGIKECGGCAKRRATWNKAVPFKRKEQPPAPVKAPVRTSVWTVPGEVPDGWTELLRKTVGDRDIVLFEYRTGKLVMWEESNGQYKNYYGYCCNNMREKAIADWTAK